MLEDARRGKFDVMMTWSIDRLVRSVQHAASAMSELDAAALRASRSGCRPRDEEGEYAPLTQRLAEQPEKW